MHPTDNKIRFNTSDSVADSDHLEPGLVVVRSQLCMPIVLERLIQHARIVQNAVC